MFETCANDPRRGDRASGECPLHGILQGAGI